MTAKNYQNSTITIQEPQPNPRSIVTKKISSKHCIIMFPKTGDKDKILQASKRKN